MGFFLVFRQRKFLIGTFQRKFLSSRCNENSHGLGLGDVMENGRNNMPSRPLAQPHSRPARGIGDMSNQRKSLVACSSVPNTSVQICINHVTLHSIPLEMPPPPFFLLPQNAPQNRSKSIFFDFFRFFSIFWGFSRTPFPGIGVKSKIFNF